MTEKKVKLLPYGIADYSVVHSPKYIYVDKTKYIELLEERYLYTFIVRPRRFGKTLFAGMLKSYYDIAAADEFEENFSGTYIGSHKTPLASSLRILYLNFSGVAGDNVAEIIYSKIESGIDLFLYKYPDEECSKILKNKYSSPASLLNTFLNAASIKYGKTLYVVIDEYDQFASEILLHMVENAKKQRASIGIMKDIYATLKKATEIDGSVARIFITGVTRFSLDSMSSGFNVARDLTNDSRFAAMFGFTEDEVRDMLPQAVDLDRYGKSAEEVLERMRTLYDGYVFAPKSKVRVFNPSMCFHYLGRIARHNDEPGELLDPAFSQDLSKIHGVLSLGDKEDAESIVGRLVSCNKLPLLSRLSKPVNIDNDTIRLQAEDMLLLLLNLGYLTSTDDGGYLTVPNAVLRRKFFKYYIKYIRRLKMVSLPYEEKRKAVSQLKEGNPSPFIESLSARLEKLNRRNDFLRMCEKDLCAVLSASTADLLEFRPFPGAKVPGKEKDCAELLLEPAEPGGAAYLFAFRFLAQKQGTPAEVAAKLAEAEAQLEAHRSGKAAALLPNLKCAACVFAGLKLAGYSLS